MKPSLFGAAAARRANGSADLLLRSAARPAVRRGDRAEEKIKRKEGKNMVALVYIGMYAWVCVCVRIYTYTHIYIYLYMYINIYIYIYMPHFGTQPRALQSVVETELK